MTKLDPQVSGIYTQWKDALLQEFKLSANVYLERFNTCIKSVDDTSKLTGLLDFYLESRHVTTYEQLCELLICDRIKTVLSEGCFRYILSIESAKDTGWLRKKDLTDAIDRYMASHPRNDIPRAFAVGQTPQAMSKQNLVDLIRQWHPQQKPCHQNLMATVRTIKTKVLFHHLVNMLAM